MAIVPHDVVFDLVIAVHQLEINAIVGAAGRRPAVVHVVLAYLAPVGRIELDVRRAAVASGVLGLDALHPAFQASLQGDDLTCADVASGRRLEALVTSPRRRE